MRSVQGVQKKKAKHLHVQHAVKTPLFFTQTCSLFLQDSLLKGEACPTPSSHCPRGRFRKTNPADGFIKVGCAVDNFNLEPQIIERQWRLEAGRNADGVLLRRHDKIQFFPAGLRKNRLEILGRKTVVVEEALGLLQL